MYRVGWCRWWRWAPMFGRRVKSRLESTTKVWDLWFVTTNLVDIVVAGEKKLNESSMTPRILVAISFKQFIKTNTFNARHHIVVRTFRVGDRPPPNECTLKLDELS